MPAQDYSFMGFLSGLLDAMKQGAQNTGYAIGEDVSDIKSGQLPQNLMHDLPGLVAMFGQGAVNPQIPAMQYTNVAIDPLTNAPVAVGKPVIAGGGNWLEMFTRQGGFGNFLQQLLQDYEKAQRE